MSERGLPDLRRGSFYVPIVMALAIVSVVVVKLSFIDGRPGPHIFGDELLNRLYAQRLHDWASYNLALHWIEPAYPPLYPLLLSFGLFVSDWYHGMLVLNVLAMGTAPVLIYAITRWFAGRPASTAAAVAAAVVPSGVLPMFFIVAESLAVPAFLLAVWAMLAPRPASLRRALFAGAAVAAAYLVKFVLLVFIPPLAMGFFLMQLALTPQLAPLQRIMVVIGRCTLVALGFVIVVGAWLLYARGWGLDPKNALGFWNAAFATPPSFDGLGFYFVLLLLAALLAVVPLLGLMAAFRPKNVAEWIYVTVVLVTMMSTVGFNAWFCWKANHYFVAGAPFDADKAVQLVTQRYMVYLTWLALPLAFVAAERVALSGAARRIVGSLVGVTLAAIASLTLVAGWFWPVAPRLVNENSYDIWSYLHAGHFLGYGPLSAVALATVPAGLLLLRPLWVGWRASALAALAAVAVFGTLDVMGLKGLGPSQWSTIGRNMAAALHDWAAEGDTALVVVDRNQVPGESPEFYAWSAMFWMAKPPLVVAGSAAAQPDGRFDVVYDWPKNRVGYWAPAKVPDIMPSAVFLLSAGAAPPGARILGQAGEPRKSYFLAPIPAGQRRVAQ